MRRRTMLSGLALATAGSLAGVDLASAQDDQRRIATRDRLGTLLRDFGPSVHIAFRQSEKNPYNFIGVLQQGLKVCNSLEVVIGVTADQTIGFRIYPYYKGAYINLNKARDPAGLERELLRYSDRNFLFFGVDETFDVFAGYTITLESGFPDEAIKVVLYSISPEDGFVGKMLPLIDGSPAV